VPNDRGVKQRGRFEGVLLSEIGANQELAVFAQGSIGKQVLLNRRETFEKEPHQPLVAAAEFVEHLR